MLFHCALLCFAAGHGLCMHSRHTCSGGVCQHGKPMGTHTTHTTHAQKNTHAHTGTHTTNTHARTHVSLPFIKRVLKAQQRAHTKNYLWRDRGAAQSCLCACKSLVRFFPCAACLFPPQPATSPPLCGASPVRLCAFCTSECLWCKFAPFVCVPLVHLNASGVSLHLLCVCLLYT